MLKKKTITFIESKKPIAEPVTKFGGLPFWIGKPQWPLSRSTNQPMCFICQIELFNDIFPDIEAKMAYLFMTYDEDDSASTWEPDGGENAIILQPGNPNIPHTDIKNGPTLFEMVIKLFKKRLFKKRPVPQLCEYAVELIEGEDPDFIPEMVLLKMPREERDEYTGNLEGDKIGGCPAFIQNDEFPDKSGTWKLLIQIDSTTVPFSINFGDSGIGYGFINNKGTDAKFLWQGC